jgi:2,3-bisphosphoglycerate-dependent phosphoglycerate mutase
LEATRIIAVRHGETAWNVDTRIQGQLDIPLNATGHRQAQQLAGALAAEPIDAIYSSDLQRALQTALPLAEALGQPITATAALRERCFGSFEGKTFAEIEAERPEQALRWRRRDPDFVPEGGESLYCLHERIAAAVDALASRHLGGLILLMSHGGVLDALYRQATRLDIGAPRTWMLGNAAINRLLWTPQGLTLVGWADTQHLADARDETTG